MIKYKQVLKTVEEKTTIQCDVCKKEYSIEDMNDCFEIQEFHHICFCGGYDSVFGDGNTIECDICQYCLKELIGPFCRYKEGDMGSK